VSAVPNCYVTSAHLAFSFDRYLKTTLFGLTGCSPDYVMLIVGGNAGLIGMSKVSQGQLPEDRVDVFKIGTLGRSSRTPCPRHRMSFLINSQNKTNPFAIVDLCHQSQLRRSKRKPLPRILNVHSDRSI
jgi:hypothetical protein